MTFLTDKQESCGWNPTTVVADPEDCRYYYQCSDGKLFHFYCGESAVFDPNAMSCVSPNTVEKCSGLTTVVSEPDTSEQEPLFAGFLIWPRSTRGSQDLVGTQNHVFLWLDIFSSGGYNCDKDGYYRDSEDCNKFYRCTDHDRHYFSCPDGLVFDEVKAACDYPSQVQHCTDYTVPISMLPPVEIRHPVFDVRFSQLANSMIEIVSWVSCSIYHTEFWNDFFVSVLT